MTLATIVFGPLLLAVATGIVAARSKSIIVRCMLLLSSPLPPLLLWFALAWYRKEYFHAHPMVETRNQVVTAGICQIQMIAAPVIVIFALFIAWLFQRKFVAR